MRRYNASFVYSRLWLLAKERNAFSGELADLYAVNISRFPPHWAPQEHTGCMAKQQQTTQTHLKLGWCHQRCSSSRGCTGNAWELPEGEEPGCSPTDAPQWAFTLPTTQTPARNATWAAPEQKKGSAEQSSLFIFMNFSSSLEHFTLADSSECNLT